MYQSTDNVLYDSKSREPSVLYDTTKIGRGRSRERSFSSVNQSTNSLSGLALQPPAIPPRMRTRTRSEEYNTDIEMTFLNKSNTNLHNIIEVKTPPLTASQHSTKSSTQSNIIKTCCGKLDRGFITFSASVLFSLIITSFSIYQIVHLETAEEKQIYIGLLSGTTSLFIPSPSWSPPKN